MNLDAITYFEVELIIIYPTHRFYSGSHSHCTQQSINQIVKSFHLLSDAYPFTHIHTNKANFHMESVCQSKTSVSFIKTCF